MLAPFTRASLIPHYLGLASSIGMNQYAQSRHLNSLENQDRLEVLPCRVGRCGKRFRRRGISGAVAGGIKGATADGTNLSAFIRILGDAGGL